MKAPYLVVVALFIFFNPIVVIAEDFAIKGNELWNKKDLVGACNMYEKSSELGELAGINLLAFCYEGGLGRNRDYKKALGLYQEGARKNGIMSVYKLGLFYEKGLGVPKDPFKAAEMYLKAGSRGHHRAQLLLGIMFAEEQGVELNYREAERWYIKSLLGAVEKEMVMYALGVLYIENLNMFDKGMAYLDLASSKGFKPAIAYLNKNFAKEGN